MAANADAAGSDAQSAYALQTEGLTKVFKGFTAVNDVNLNVRRGHIHALIGPNGAGKTTVFNLLTHFLKPTHGRIVYEGNDITDAKPYAIARMGVVRSFQISSTFPHLTCLENVRVALQRREGMDGHFWRSTIELNTLNDEAMALLAAVGVDDAAEMLASELPYGRKRSLELATTLALEPKLLLLDEPTQGMGHEDVGRITALIRKVAEGRTVLMVEHNLSVVADLCDRITVLQRGAVLAEGDYAEVSENQDVRDAYMGSGH